MEAWTRSEEADPFAHPTHVDLFSPGNDSAFCAVLTVDDGQVLLPFVLRTIQFSDHVDVTSAYGYGGPFVSGTVSRSDLEGFWEALDGWSRARGVVSEFIRFSTSPDDDAFAYQGDVVHRSTTVVRVLDLDAEALWMDFDHKVRKSVNKARRNGVTVTVDTTGERLDEFLGIYAGTMSRREADERYLFPRDFFERIRDEMSGSYAFFHADLEGVMISTELVLVGRRTLYSYLGGTDERHFAVRPNDMLKFEVMNWGQTQGKTEFVLGGGASPGDGIERYKLSFAPQGARRFYTGQRVVDAEAYRELSGPGEDEFFPAYRRTRS